jgi:hypothetical protein
MDHGTATGDAAGRRPDPRALMGAAWVLIAGGALTALVGGGVVITMHAALRAVLWELCLAEHRARFWERTCLVALVAGTALAVTLGASRAAPVSPVFGVALMLRWALAGALGGVVVIAAVVLREARRFDHVAPPSRW